MLLLLTGQPCHIDQGMAPSDIKWSISGISEAFIGQEGNTNDMIYVGQEGNIIDMI